VKEPSQAPVTPRYYQGYFGTTTIPALDTKNCFQNQSALIDLVQPPHDKSYKTDDSQDSEQTSRNSSLKTRHSMEKHSETIIHKPVVDYKKSFYTKIIQYKKLKAEHTTLQLSHDSLKAELDILKREHKTQAQYVDRYNYIVRHFLLPYAQSKDLQFDDRTAETLTSVMNLLLQNARDAENLRDQSQTLQKELLAIDEMSAAIPDARFAKDFCTLAAHIETLSRLLHPYPSTDVVSTLGPCTMTHDVAPHHWNTPVGSKLFIEAWTWSILIDQVFSDPFTIFGVAGRTIANFWSSMYGAQHSHGWPAPSSACETWRRGTVEQLVASVDEEIITLGKAKEDCYTLERHIVDARAAVVHAVLTGLASITSAVDSSQVLQIVDAAFGLQMHLALQQARFQVCFPKSGERFDEGQMTMQAISDEEDGAKVDIVAAVVNPGLMKWGGGQGKSFEQRYAIVPALVRLEAL
jgi:hypothetical protein